MLSGIRILVVEDEPSVAATLVDLVEDAGGEVIGIACSVSEARQMIRTQGFDAAVLDLNLSDGEVTPVLEALQARKAATVVYSGGELPAHVRQRHPELVALRKPVLPSRLLPASRQIKSVRDLHSSGNALGEGRQQGAEPGFKAHDEAQVQERRTFPTISALVDPQCA